MFRHVFYEQYLLKVMGVHFTKIFLVVLQKKWMVFFMKWPLVFYLLLHSPWPQRLNLNVSSVLKMSFEVRKKLQKVCKKNAGDLNLICNCSFKKGKYQRSKFFPQKIHISKLTFLFKKDIDVVYKNCFPFMTYFFYSWHWIYTISHPIIIISPFFSYFS